MLSWFTGTIPGKIISTFFISMVPVIELRGGLPFGISQGLPYSVALIAAVAGNLLPVPFIILFIRKIFAFLRRFGAFEGFVEKLEKKAHLKGRKVRKYGPLWLCILVAIPLPGTGAWTGALVAAILDIRLKRAIPAIVIGVLIAAAIMTGITYGVIAIV